MAVIEEYMHNNCRVVVHDDCIEDAEGVERIIDNLCRIMADELLRKQKNKGKGPQGQPWQGAD